MKRIKVVYLIDTLVVGGAEKSLVDIAINNPSIDSVFITIYKGDALAPLLEKNNIEVYKLDNTFKYGFDAALQQLLPLIDSIKPDIIHSTLFRSDIIARKVKAVRDVVLVSSFVNNSYAKVRYDKMSFVSKCKLFGIQLFDRWTAKKVDLFISNSQTIKNSNGKSLGVNENKIKVIYRGRSSKKFSENADVDALRTDLKINVDTKIMLNVSRLLDRKGQLDLLQSFEKITRENPNVVLLIAGEGAYRSVLANEIEKLGLKGKAILLGSRNDIPALLQLADIFVFPSHYEGLPGALIEAMFAQKIIICSDIGENTECVTSNDAILFKTANVEELYEKMQLVLNNLEEYKKFGINAKQAAIQKFELSNIVQQYNSTYTQLLKNNN